MISEQEAFVLWARAAGFTYAAIAKRLGNTESSARNMFYRGIVKSRAYGVSYLRDPAKAIKSPQRKSAKSNSELKEAEKLATSGFSLLKKMAQEAAAEIKNLRKK